MPGERSGEPVVSLRRDGGRCTIGTRSVRQLLTDSPAADFGGFAKRVVALLVAGAHY
jgi:hypothetical protein